MIAAGENHDNMSRSLQALSAKLAALRLILRQSLHDDKEQIRLLPEDVIDMRKDVFLATLSIRSSEMYRTLLRRTCYCLTH